MDSSAERLERGYALNDDTIENYAHQVASTLPESPPEAERPRRRFNVERVWKEGERYVGVRVCVDDGEFLTSFTRPGQYVTFQHGPIDPRFLVIASAPGAEDDDHWDFLIDRDSELGEVAAGLEKGSRVLLSPAEGSGYPADDLSDQSVLFFTTGAGIASVRPVLEYWADRPDLAPQSLALYYGENEPHDFAYVSEFADWRARGVRIYQAVENLPEPEEGYRYVQHAFEDDAPELADTQIFVSGAPVMMELIIARLMRMGVPGEHIHINV